MATKTFYEMHTHTTWRRPICQLANCTPVSVCAGSCITSTLSAGTPALTCNDMRKRCSESARPILQRQTRQLQANRTHESHCQLCHARAKFSNPRLDLRHSFGKMGRAGHRTLLSETRQSWPQTRSMKCTRTHTHTKTWRPPTCQLANCTPVSVCAGSCITSTLSAGTPALTCNDMRKRCSESARPILQRQTRQLQANRTHESQCQLCHARAKFSTPHLDLRHSGSYQRQGQLHFDQ